MEPIIFENGEEAVSQMNTGDRKHDLEMVNAILSGNVHVGKQNEEGSVEEEPTNQDVSETEDTEQNEVVEPSVPNQDSIDELERQKKYIEMIEAREAEEREKVLLDLAEKEKAYAKEKEIRENLEKRIQEIENRKRVSSEFSQEDIDEDEEFVSDYTKKTRRMVEDLKSEFGSNPRIEELSKDLSEIKSELERESRERKALQDKKAREEAMNKTFDTIRSFIKDKDEFKTTKDIKDIDAEYQIFRKDLAFVTKSKSKEELDRYTEEYKAGGPIKEVADQYGIKAPSDLDVYDKIADLIDFKNGKVYDPVLKSYTQLKDDSGNPVRYRSIDEAYNIKNYYNNLSQTKRSAYKEISKKLSLIENSPTQLSTDDTDSFRSSYTVEQELDIIKSDPKTWINDPDKLKMAKEVYAKRGLELPLYRGRKL